MALFGGIFSKATGETPPLNRWQEAFIRWNAERLNTTVDESRERYLASLAAVEGGHSGREFRKFCSTAHEVYRVLWSDERDEVLDAYHFHAPMHFLRMLSYPEYEWADDDTIVAGLRGRPDVVIADYGCGLAQQSIGLALKLDTKPSLFLADIPTIRKDFLTWFAADLRLSCAFGDVTKEAPIPTLPACDLCIAEQVFEHIYDPIAAFETIHAGLRPGGFFKTNVADHKDEFMHVTPKLDALRQRISDLGYEVLIENRLFRKPS